MGTYIGLANWTDQGVREAKNSPQRLDAAKALAKSLGCEIKSFYMTMGVHDLVTVFEAPSDAACAQFLLRLAQGGSLRTVTLKAFTEAEYREVMKAL